MTEDQIRLLTDEALDAFWQVIANHFPQATGGELSIDRTIRLQVVAEEAIEEWIKQNVPHSA
jgi:hypothetical protein